MKPLLVLLCVLLVGPTGGYVKHFCGVCDAEVAIPPTVKTVAIVDAVPSCSPSEGSNTMVITALCYPNGKMLWYYHETLCPKCLKDFERKHAELIKAAERIFGGRTR